MKNTISMFSTFLILMVLLAVSALANAGTIAATENQAVAINTSQTLVANNSPPTIAVAALSGFTNDVAVSPTTWANLTDQAAAAKIGATTSKVNVVVTDYVGKQTQTNRAADTSLTQSLAVNLTGNITPAASEQSHRLTAQIINTAGNNETNLKRIPSIPNESVVWTVNTSNTIAGQATGTNTNNTVITATTV